MKGTASFLDLLYSNEHDFCCNSKVLSFLFTQSWRRPTKALPPRNGFLSNQIQTSWIRFSLLSPLPFSMKSILLRVWFLDEMATTDDGKPKTSYEDVSRARCSLIPWFWSTIIKFRSFHLISSCALICFRWKEWLIVFCLLICLWWLVPLGTRPSGRRSGVLWYLWFWWRALGNGSEAGSCGAFPFPYYSWGENLRSFRVENANGCCLKYSLFD